MRAALLAAMALTVAAPAAAQHAGHNMPAKPAAQPAADPHAGHATPTPNEAPPSDPHAGHDMSNMPAEPEDETPTPADPHAGHDMGSMPNAVPAAPADPHAGHDMSAMPQAGNAGQDAHTGHDMGAMSDHNAPIGTNLPVGNAPAPTAFPDLAAGRFWGQQQMRQANRELHREHGGGVFRQVNFNLAEVQVRDGRDGFRWDGEGWIGGDINRLTLKTEGEGEFGRGVEGAEIQALYSRAVGPFFNLQAGVRYDFKPNPSRTYATVGFEGLAPYWFDVEGALFLSDKGDVLGRLEGYYDQRVTQRLILQPRAELEFAAQDVPENGIGSGLSTAELGLRLRYEIRRAFAPYVGVSWDRSFGDTARFARAEGEGVEATSLVIGVRSWF